jgi:glycosyltransferase involved in cell wall biosynthesis
MKPTKVLMLLQNNPYPRDKRVRREATTLAEAGYQVTVICPSAKGQPWREDVNGVYAYRFPAPPEADGLLGYLLEYGYSMIAAFFLSIVVLFQRGFHIIHAHNPPDMFVFVAMMYKLFGKRFVFDHHDLSPEMYKERFEGKGNPRIHKILLWMEKVSCRAANHVIATNQSYKNLQMERNGVPEERITIVRNGPDIRYETEVEPADDVQQAGRMLLAYVGIMGHQDGVDYLLKALHHLADDLEQTDFYCILMGTGAAYDELQLLTKELQLEDYVNFMGWTEYSRVLSILKAADICLAPEPSNEYNDRSTMIKITEYMASAKPIVAFDLPEHRYSAGEAAVYAGANEPLEFARKIQYLMENPDKREEMGRFGRNRMETEMAWSFQAEKLLRAYDTLKN